MLVVLQKTDIVDGSCLMSSLQLTVVPYAESSAVASNEDMSVFRCRAGVYVRIHPSES